MGRQILKNRKKGIKKVGLATITKTAKALDDTLCLVKVQDELKRELEGGMWK